MPSITYQLKYCERCGSLRLRPANSAENYCQPCEQALFHRALPEETVRWLRQARPSDPALKAGNAFQSQLEPIGGRLSSPAKSRASARDLSALPHGRLQ